MDAGKTNREIDEALKATAAVILSVDTVAVWDMGEEMYGIYTKGGAKWYLAMTAINLKPLEGKG